MLEDILIAAAGGILPALLWLLFWIREDRKHPEPRRLLALAFFTGMLVVIPVLKFESIVYNHVADVSGRLIWWSAIEELGKFLGAYAIILRRRDVDEPIDLVIYMVTVALGFAALENTLFIFHPLASGLAVQTIFTGGLRFIGATLLHISASASVGVAMALAFYKKARVKHLFTLVGLILAIILHTAFNLTIIGGDGRTSMLASGVVWLAVICLLLLFEKVKKVHPVRNN